MVATLGTGDDEQFIDALEGTYKESFLLHYNFPPYSVGETGRMGSPGRREIGHGKLAWRALRPMLPSTEDFRLRHPPGLRDHRVERLVLDGHGLRFVARHDGRRRSAGPSGLGHRHGPDLEEDGFAVLSDILGDEDRLGDMDFKVAGTAEGLTSLQMDIKIAGITPAIMEQALAQAKGGREHILGEMDKAMDAPREDVGDYAPKIETITHPDRQDPRSDRHRRQGDPRDRRHHRRQGRHQRRRHREGLGLGRRQDQGRDRAGSSRSPRKRKSARSTTARW